MARKLNDSADGSQLPTAEEMLHKLETILSTVKRDGPSVPWLCQQIRRCLLLRDVDGAVVYALALGAAYGEWCQGRGMGHVIRDAVGLTQRETTRRVGKRQSDKERATAAAERKQAILDAYSRVPEETRRHGKMAVYRYIVTQLKETRWACKMSVVRAALKDTPIASG